jgi:hypothetical protein
MAIELEVLEAQRVKGALGDLGDFKMLDSYFCVGLLRRTIFYKSFGPRGIRTPDQGIMSPLL